MSQATIGVLALQGDFSEHCKSVESCGANAVAIRYLRQLDTIDGLLIPGGESTTINKFDEATRGSWFSTIRGLGLEGLPIYGTCMGTIMLSSKVGTDGQSSLRLMDVSVERNAYGPQKKSFEVEVEIPCLGPDSYPAVFIRAPKIASVGPGVEVLAKFDNTIIMARQNQFLVTTFHPEVTDDLRVHQLFLDMVQSTGTTNLSFALPSRVTV